MVYNEIDNNEGGDNMEQPILRLQKNAEKSMNKIVIPRAFVRKWGYKFYMEVYEDKIVLIPINADLRRNNNE